MITPIASGILGAAATDGGLIDNLAENMTNLKSLVSSLFGVIGSTPVLAVMFTASLAAVGFKFIRRAKKTAK